MKWKLHIFELVNSLTKRNYDDITGFRVHSTSASPRIVFFKVGVSEIPEQKFCNYVYTG